MDVYNKEIKIQLLRAQLELFSRRRQFAKSNKVSELKRYLASSESGLLIGYTFYLFHLEQRSPTQQEIMEQTGLTRQYVF